jgi:WD40 repeat protein
VLVVAIAVAVTITPVLQGRVPADGSIWTVVRSGSFLAAVALAVVVAAASMLQVRLQRTPTQENGDVAAEGAANARREATPHLVAAGNGVSNVGQDGSFFRGRRAALREISAWLAAPATDQVDPRVLIVTGSPGTGKSAVLGRIVITASDSQERIADDQPDEVTPPPGSIGIAIEAAGKTPLDLARQIARAVGHDIEEVKELTAALVSAQGSRDRPFTILVDGLDEAAASSAGDVVSSVLRPMSQMEARYGIRLLLGTRASHRGDDLIHPFPGARTIDLDSDRYFEVEDLKQYALARLQQQRPGNPYLDGDLAGPIANEIAIRSNRNFLVAGLIAHRHGKDDAVAIGPPDVRVPADLMDVLRHYLRRVPLLAGLPARQILKPLAYAEAPGLPADLWSAALRALFGIETNELQLRTYARELARDYLIETVPAASDGQPVYRMFHQALSDSLVGVDPSAPESVSDNARITTVFLSAAPSDWTGAPGYLVRSLASHAAAAQMVPELIQLLESSDYPLHADLGRLQAALRADDSEGASRYRRLLGMMPASDGMGSAERAAAWSVTEALRGVPAAKNRFATMAMELGASYVGAWGAAWTSEAMANVLTGHTDVVLSVAVAPDGQTVVTGSGDGTVRVWDLQTGAPSAVLTSHIRFASSAVVSPDCRHAIICSEDGQVLVWNLHTRTHRTMFVAGDETGSLAVTPDGGRLVVGRWAVRYQDLRTGDRETVLDQHTGAIRLVTSDGRHVVTGGYHSLFGEDEPNEDGVPLQVWDLDTGTERTVRAGLTDRIGSMAVSPDGRFVVSGGGEKTMHIWDLKTGIGRNVHTESSSRIGSVAVTSDGRHAVIGNYDGTLRLWDLLTETELARLAGHSDVVRSVAITPDGRQAISGSDDHTVRVWDLHVRDTRPVRTGHTDVVRAVALTPDGRHAVTGSSDGTARVWDLKDGTERVTLTGHTGWVLAVAAAPSGHAVTAGTDGTIRVWHLRTGRLLATLIDRIDVVWAVAVSPDGRHILSGSTDRTIRIWDLQNRTLGAKLIGHTDVVGAVTTTPDGQHVVSGSADRTVRVWDMKTHTLRATLKGHTGAVRAITVTPDGQHIISAGADRTVRIWDLVDQTLKSTLIGHTDAVVAVAVTPDGNHIISTGPDRTIRTWDLNRQTALDVIHAPDQVQGVATSGSRMVQALTSGVLAVDISRPRRAG